MGAQPSDSNMKLVLFDIDWKHKSTIENWNINPIFETKIEQLKNNHSTDLLSTILTSNNGKIEILKWIKIDKLTKINVFVLTSEEEKNAKINDFDQAVVMTSNKIQLLLQAISNKNQSVNFNPLARITREIKIKVQVKIIEYDLENETFKRLYRQLLEKGCSVQICQSFESFEGSLIFSRSDFVISRQSTKFHHQKNSLETNNYYKQIIHYSEDSERRVGKWWTENELLSVPKKYQLLWDKTTDASQPYRLECLTDFIATQENKQGYVLKPFTKIFIMSRTSNKKQAKLQRRRAKIEALKRIYDQKISGNSVNKGLQLTQFDNNEQLFKQLKKVVNTNNYVIVLFIHYKSSNIRIVREGLKQMRNGRNVMMLTMKSFPINFKLQDKHKDKARFEKIRDTHYYRIEKKTANTVDIIWDSEKDLLTSMQKRHLEIFTSLNQFKSLEEYEKMMSQQSNQPSHFIIGNYNVIKAIRENYLLKNDTNRQLSDKFKSIENLKLICFDSVKNLLLFKTEKVLDPEENKNLYCTDNILEVKDIINTNPLQQLILHEETFEKQAALYNQVIQKLFVVKRKGKFHELQGEVEGNFYKLSQQTSFFEDMGFDTNWTTVLKNFLVQYCLLWKLEYLPTKDFKRIKEDCIKSLNKLYKTEVIQTNDTTFYKQYLNKVTQCDSLTKLAETAIYLFTLPHGMYSALNYLLMNFTLNLRMINVFKPLFFVLMLNYNIIFQPKYQMEKRTLYVQYKKYWEKETNFKVQFQNGSKLYNINFLECRETVSPNTNYVEIEYEYSPLHELSPYYNILRTQLFSFYKTDAQHRFSPFSCFEVKEITKSAFQEVVKVKHIPNRLFVSNLMQCNLSSHDPISDVLLPLIKQQKVDFVGPKNLQQKGKSNVLKEKQKSAIYHNFIQSCSNNQINKAEHYFQMRNRINQQSKLKQDKQSKAFIAFQEVWLLIKQGDYQNAKLKVDKIQNALQGGLRNSFKDIKVLIDQIVQKRNKILKQNNLHIFSSSHLVTNAYNWDCKYQQQFDQFVLSETPPQQQLADLENKLANQFNFGFIRIPEMFSFMKDAQQPERSERVLGFTKIAHSDNKQLGSVNKVKNGTFKLSPIEGKQASSINQDIEKQEEQSDSSDEELNSKSTVEKTFKKVSLKGVRRLVAPRKNNLNLDD